MDEDNIMNPKVSGYLEKKSKMKMMNSYKRYWFVLEGRLLLYYRSKDEYEAISPCKGSINLGPACNIKTCPSTSGAYVFQIETRTSTITLRATNREDQSRWMQGIMSALNQNKNAKKLSHFRYSLDELSQQALNKSGLRRKTTIPPHSDCANNQSDKDKGIIQRLQKIGAHSYSGSMGAINQIENKCQKTNNSNETVNLTGLRSSVSVENDHYGLIIKNNSSTNIETRKEPRLKENIYERISGDSSISTHSRQIHCSTPGQTSICNNGALLKNNRIMSYDQQNHKITDTENKSRPTTFLLENEAYGEIQLNTEDNDSQNKIKYNSFILDSNQYYDIDNIIKFPNTDSEIIYAEPKCSSAIDHNDNNLISNKIKGEENAYSITKLYDSEKNSVDSTQYEIVAKCGVYSEPKCQTEKNTKLKKHKLKKPKTIVDENKKELKLKKSSSFIKRVWRKKRKNKESDTEELYETIPDSPTDKLELTNDAAIQMLSELQNILENKVPQLLDQCSKSHIEKLDNENVTKNNTKENSNSQVDNAATVQMLTELQNILKNKKPVVCELTTEGHATESPTLNLGSEKTIPENASCSSKSERMCPAKHKSSTYSPCHDIPKNNRPIPLPPKKKQNMDNVSLDKILDDLVKEKNEDFINRKVKNLIKQFNESDSEFDVELRTNKRSDISREDVDANELSRLLDELVKVTCAPILTPGATSSLISTNLTDEEIIRLLPTRQRRHSDPDYDVPRPHKSLVNLPRKQNSPENIIGSTRFFGPILNCTDNYKGMNHEKNLDNSPQMLSMTPDSLEPISMQLEKCTPQPYIWEDRNSYSSNKCSQMKHYNVNNKQKDFVVENTNVSTYFDSSINSSDKMIENDIYVQPKSLYNVELIKENDNNVKSLTTNNSKFTDENLEDVFIDSLEIGENIPASN